MRPRFLSACGLALALALAACGGDDAPPPDGCTPLPAFTVGDPTGHAQPLGASATEARAGRLGAADLPPVASGLITWQPGDFVLANDRVALVIEDVGDSDLYDPWGGRPVGLARVAGGRLIEPANFGEVFLLTGRASLVTEDVSVLSDGSGGGPAIIRTVGRLHPVPFFEAVTAGLFQELTGVRAAIDYELAPGSSRVDVRFRYLNDTERQLDTGAILHALMYTKRTPVVVPGAGFSDDVTGAPWIGLVDDLATSWAYVPADRLGTAVSVSGFVGGFGPGFAVAACHDFDRVHAQLIIGGPGLDGLVAAVADEQAAAVRVVTGTVVRAGAPLAGAHVHAVDDATGAYLTRAVTAADGSFTVHVPADATVKLAAVADAAQLVEQVVAPGAPAPTLTLPAPAQVRVVVTDLAGPLPARVQLLPRPGQGTPTIPAAFGEPRFAGGRLAVTFTVTGDVTLAVPPGNWELVVSHGFAYDVARRDLTAVSGQAQRIDVELPEVVPTPGVQCADFHIHTWRSNDSGDDGLLKVASAIADGLELPVRSDHEYVGDFAAEIDQLGAQRWAAGFGSIELTSFEVWGHMGVFPLTADPTKVNAGAPRWQTFPTADAPDTAFATLSPVAVFDAVRARPEAPVVIINHPRGGANYFDYVGFDPATGMVSSAADWDQRFTLVEVFNDSGWQSNRDGTVRDWLGLLRAGRKIFAVGSSDSHGLTSSPVGYPRTCLELGTDDPRALTAPQVRDTLAAGHGAVVGGIYVTATVDGNGPGATVTGLGMTAQVAITIRAASWVDVDAFDLVVDGETVDTVPIMPGDADPLDPAVRWRGTLPIDVRADGSGFVVVAAYGDAPLEPVHPGRHPFGVTNPIFVKP
ncbi:MAG: CehA/McbA family metallohydrolase [Kofleriaceae bacterium]